MYLSVSGSGFHMNQRIDFRLPKLQGSKLTSANHNTLHQQNLTKNRLLNSPDNQPDKPSSPDRFFKYLSKQVQSQKGIQRQQVPQLIIQSSMILIAKSMKFSQDQHTHRIKEKPQKLIQVEESNDYKYFLGTGNNHELIQRVMETRADWVLTKDNSSMFVHFRWQQSQRGYKYDRLIANNQYKQMVNHFEHHAELSNKQYLFKNLCSYFEQQKQNVYDYLPITFVLDFNDDQVDLQFTQFIKLFDKFQPKDKKIDQMAKKLVELKKKLKIPVASQQDKKLNTLIPTKIPKCQTGPQYMWLLKPTFLNRGRGIHVINDLDTLVTLIYEYQEGLQTQEDEESKKKNNIKANTFVVQKYIEHPFLIHNRKFDIRVWVLVTQDLNCYFFKEGYIRTSCECYSTEDIDNQYIHLTNNAIQKNSEKYGEFEDGNQLSFDDFQKYLNQQGLQVDFYENHMTKMKNLAWASLQSVKRKINLSQRKYCMEIFGYDYILDDDLKTWLIEVNTNPCLEESSGILKTLIPRMIDDAFKLTIDVIFPPKNKTEPPESVFPVPKYSNNENLWEALGSLESPKITAKLNQLQQLQSLQNLQQNQLQLAYQQQVSFQQQQQQQQQFLLCSQADNKNIDKM